jgi:hypothetical protein
MVAEVETGHGGVRRPDGGLVAAKQFAVHQERR